MHAQLMIRSISSSLSYIGKRSDWLKGDLATLWSDLRRLDLTQWRYLGRLILRESPEVSDGRQGTYICQQNCSNETSRHLSLAYTLFMSLNLLNYLSEFNKCQVNTVTMTFLSLHYRQDIQSLVNGQIKVF